MSIRQSITSFQERSPLYEDVRSLLNPGFLTMAVRHHKVSMSLRTLNSDDLFLIESRASLQPESWHDWLLASSIWIFDNHILERDQEVVLWVYNEVQKFPRELKSCLLSANSILTKRFVRAKNKALAYFYERESRDLWGGRGSKLFDNTFAWVGRNSIQDLWVYYNRMEDVRQQRTFEQNLAAFGASPHAPKSIKKIHERMKSDEDQLEAERSIVQDKMYFDSFGISFEDNRFLRRGFGLVEVATTVEELQEQYKNYLEGKKDRHDLAIDDARRRLVAKKEERRKLREKRIQEVQRIRQERIPNQEGPTMLVGKAAEEYMQQMKEEAQKHRAGWVSAEDDSQMSFQKHIESEIQRPKESAEPLSEEDQRLMLEWMKLNPSQGKDLTKDLQKPRMG